MMSITTAPKRTFFFLAKLAVSAILIGWVLIDQVAPSELIPILQGANPGFLLLSFLSNLVGLLIGALRWKKLLACQGINVRLRSLVDSYIIGFFFNIFMPTRIGGDFIRVADLRHASKSVSKSASTVFVERFLGMSVLFGFAFGASLLRLPLAKELPAIWVGLTIGIAGLSISIAILRFHWVDRLTRIIPWPTVRDRLASAWYVFRSEVLSLVSKRRSLGWGLFLSFLLQLNVIAHFYILGKALGFTIPLCDYFFLIPIQLVILMLPSINGIGLREVSGIALFHSYGIGSSAAVAFGIMDLAMMMLLGLAGAFRFVLRRTRPRAIDAQEVTGTPQPSGAMPTHGMVKI